MTTYQWDQLRSKAADLYGGDTPQPALEQRILKIFATNPALVATSIDTIGDRYKAGLIRSPWAVLAVHLEHASQPTQQISSTDTVDRAKRIARAEQWIRAAGVHFDEPSLIQ